MALDIRELRHNYYNDRQTDPRRSWCPPRATASMPKSGPSLEEGTLNPAPGKVHDPKFQDGEFFDPRDIVQVKYEMLRRVSVENASVTNATEEYGVSRPTYYQTKASFDEAGSLGWCPGSGSARPAQGAGRRCWRSSRSNWSRASPFARANWRTDPAEIRSRDPPKDDRASGRGKKNSAMTRTLDTVCGATEGRWPQYETLRNAALGHALPPEARSRAHALSPSRHVGMGAGVGHGMGTCAAAADWPRPLVELYGLGRITEPSFISLPPWP